MAWILSFVFCVGAFVFAFLSGFRVYEHSVVITGTVLVEIELTHKNLLHRNDVVSQKAFLK